MVNTIKTLASLVLAGVVASATPVPLIIAHRGASGHRPEHTIAGYTLAIEMGADVIEPDLVSTKDGVLIARHENEIGTTSDVAAKFPARKTTKKVDGASITGWFTEDFTLAEIKTLRANERLEFRSHAFDGQFQIPTFEEVLDLAVAKSRETGRTISVYPETKHPTYFRGLNLPIEEPMLASLKTRGMTTKTSPVFIQSFEASSLQRMRPLTGARLVMLVSNPATVTVAKLAEMRAYADGVGAEKRLVIPVDKDGKTQTPTSLIADAHAAGLFVHIWT
ncbi:MAG: glycerophosphodiester phosphodiesterase family protein, partial [Acidobacteriota bacterium]